MTWRAGNSSMVSLMEIGPIRPPSEAYSLLIRVTRNCPWNKCLFCHTYKGLQFSRRPVEEVKADIRAARQIAEHIRELSWASGYAGEITGDLVAHVAQRYGPAYQQVGLWMFKGAKNAFLQDANNLSLPAGQLAEVLICLRETFPSLERVTTYARSSSVAKKSVAELEQLRLAGLTRIHIGLESGYDPLLAYMRKGATAAVHVEAGLKVKEAGMELSEYVILGLGGREMSGGHAAATAQTLSRISPDFIRLRTLAVRPGMPLYDRLTGGEFEPLTEDEVVAEERLFLENLHCSGTTLVSDHSLNLLMELGGRLPEERGKMLQVIDAYLSLPDAERLLFQLGRRLGIYQCLDDLADPARRRQLEPAAARLCSRGGVEETLHQLRSQFI